VETVAVDHALLVRTDEDHAAAAGHSVDVEGWSAEFDTGLPVRELR
jgi:hypothetical protein